MTSTSPTVLLIDGNEDSRDLYTHLLRHYGFRVLGEHEGAGPHRPDLVIIADHDEQGRDGCDRALEWTHAASTDPPPVLLLTSYAEGPRWERIRESECVVVLVIPVLPITLVAHVRKLLGERDGFHPFDAGRRHRHCSVPAALAFARHDAPHLTITERQ